VTCSCFAPAVCCSEVPKFFSEVPTVRATVCRVFKSRKFRDFSRRFRTLKYSRYCSRSGGIYTPWSPNGYLLLPSAQNAVPTCFSHLAFTPNLLSSKLICTRQRHRPLRLHCRTLHQHLQNLSSGIRAFVATVGLTIIIHLSL
jgi:hypothetical protein